MLLKNIEVSVVIVNWNGHKYLGDCLSSLRNQDIQNFEVLLVDNGSTDGSVHYVENHYPDVRIIANDRNVGFARANNIGIDRSSGDIICLLNQDTIVAPNFISSGLAILSSDSNIGLCSPKIKYFGTDRLWYAGGQLHRGLRLLREASLRPTANLGKGERDDGRYDQAAETDFATGCAVFVSRQFVDAVGQLDGGYFMYFEDADWSIRARNAGYKVVYSPATVVEHKESTEAETRSAVQLGIKYVRYARSSVRFVRRNFTFFERLGWFIKLPIASLITGVRHAVQLKGRSRPSGRKSR